MTTKGKILVVDDELALRELLSIQLADEGYEVVKAPNGREAIKKMEEERPDLVLMDIEMPGGDGFSTCGVLRKNPAYDSIPIIMISVRDRASDIHHALDVGADDYIIKRPSPRELLTKIEIYLSRAKEGKLLSQQSAQERSR